MIKYILAATLITTSAYGDCIGKHTRRILKLNTKATQADDLAAELCKQLSPLHRDIAIAIMATETGIKQINSRNDKDIGFFQISIREVVSRGLSQQLLESSIPYQVGVFKQMLKEKLVMCAKRYPFTAFACFHSATPVYHYRYLQRVERFYSKIKGVR